MLVCDVRAAEGEVRRTRFLEAIRAGSTIDAAVSAAGWASRSAYRAARKHHPWWAARVDYEYCKARNGQQPSWTPTFGGPESKWPHLRSLNY